MYYLAKNVSIAGFCAARIRLAQPRLGNLGLFREPGKRVFKGVLDNKFLEKPA
jgi:hypothetical protein